MGIKDSNTYETFDTTNIPEEVLSKIYLIEREESPIYSSAKKMKTKSTSPEWQTQALASAGDNINAEGDEFAEDAITPTVRVKNHTQILDKVCSVTGTNQAVSHYGYANEMAYQKELKMKELKRDIERAIVQNNASVAGSSGTGREMGGFETWIATNASRGAGGSGTGYNSGTGLTVAPTDGTQRVFTEELLLSVLQTGYDNGAKFSALHAGSFNKRKISGFNGNATRFSDDRKKVSNTIEFYESDYGTLTCMINPRQRTRSVILYDMDKIGILQLRAMETGKIAKTHDSNEEYILTEMTTKVVEKGLGIVADLTTS